MFQLNTADISQLAVKYQNDLRTLPFVVLEEELSKLGINVMLVANKDVKTKFRRKGNFIGPYVPGAPINYINEVGKFGESALEVKKCKAAIRDHIFNYKDKMVMGKPSAGTSINQTKKHPHEMLIVEAIARTVAEDILDAMFFAERNETISSSLTAFDGFNKKITQGIVSGEIAAPKGNLINIGNIVAPVDSDDFTPIEQAVEFVRRANLHLRRRPAFLQMTPMTYQHLVDALENKFKYKDFDITAVANYINTKSKSKVSLAVGDILGKGSRLTLTEGDNFDFGMDTFSDPTFIQARYPYEDPNEIQWWVQFDGGTRVTDFDKKVFAISDGTVEGETFSGDY